MPMTNHDKLCYMLEARGYIRHINPRGSKYTEYKPGNDTVPLTQSIAVRFGLGYRLLVGKHGTLRLKAPGLPSSINLELTLRALLGGP